jgi:very-short-patch-repair endonuclease
MLLGETKRVPEGSGNNRLKTFLKLKCDKCGVEFERDFNVKIIRETPRHYCCFECHHAEMKRGGVADTARKETCQERYGSDYYLTQHDFAVEMSRRGNSPEARERAVASMQTRWNDNAKVFSHGLTIPRSNSELEFLHMLSVKLGRELVSQKYINKRWVDVYDPVKDAYIEFDGEYWHNLTNERKTRDNEQTTWFALNQKHFLRVSETRWRRDKNVVLDEVAHWIEQL